MREKDFKRALARVQSDYGFYIDCQVDPASALEGYDLSVDERAALSDPEKLAEVLKTGVGAKRRFPSITVKISGTHDWVNRAATEDRATDQADRHAKVAAEVEAVQQATGDAERTAAVARLLELIG